MKIEIVEGENKMGRSEKLFEIGKCIDGRLEYFYNRKQREKPVYLLTVDNKDGTIHIGKGYYLCA